MTFGITDTIRLANSVKGLYLPGGLRAHSAREMTISVEDAWAAAD